MTVLLDSIDEAAWWFKGSSHHLFDSSHGAPPQRRDELLVKRNQWLNRQNAETWTASRVINFEHKHTWPSISYVKSCSNVAHKVLLVPLMLINTEWHSRPGQTRLFSEPHRRCDYSEVRDSASSCVCWEGVTPASISGRLWIRAAQRSSLDQPAAWGLAASHLTSWVTAVTGNTQQSRGRANWVSTNWLLGSKDLTHW